MTPMAASLGEWPEAMALSSITFRNLRSPGWVVSRLIIMQSIFAGLRGAPVHRQMKESARDVPSANSGAAAVAARANRPGYRELAEAGASAGMRHVVRSARGVPKPGKRETIGLPDRQHPETPATPHATLLDSYVIGLSSPDPQRPPCRPGSLIIP